MTRYARPVVPGRRVHIRSLRQDGLSVCGSARLLDDDVPEPEARTKLCAKCARLESSRSLAVSVVYQCSTCHIQWPSADAALRCCGDQAAYHEALGNAMFQCHGDHLWRMKSLVRKLKRDSGVRGGGVSWRD